jgi:RNA polymerase sigma factor (sigma-70 family)
MKLILYSTCKLPQGNTVKLMIKMQNTVQGKGIDFEHEEYMRGLVVSMARRDSGAEQSLSTLYDLTVRRVAATIGRFIPDRDLVAELTQDTFFQAWNQAHLFDSGRGNVLAWLLIIARSRALDARRRENVQPIVFDSDVADAMLAVLATNLPSGVDALQVGQEQRLLQDVILTLNPTARHIVALSYFAGLSHSEISVQLEIPLGTIKSTLRRGLAGLAIELERVAPGISLNFGLDPSVNEVCIIE